MRGYRYKVRRPHTAWLVVDSCQLNIFGSNCIEHSFANRSKARIVARQMNLEHPKHCPSCGKKGAVTLERFSKKNGEFVCDECGWGTPIPRGAAGIIWKPLKVAIWGT